MSRRSGYSRRPQSAVKSDTDSEAMRQQLAQIKKEDTNIKIENQRLKTELQRHQAMIKKKDKQIKKIVELKLGEMDERSATSKLNEVKSEMLAICTLTNKIRDMEKAMEEKDEELKVLKSSMKFTLIKELQIEAQTYFNEARRLKQILDAQNSA